jgi:hypothetical protein
LANIAVKRKLKYVLLSLFLFTGFASFSQSITKEDVLVGLIGKWELVYENKFNPLIEPVELHVGKLIIELKKRKGVETGVYPNSPFKGPKTKIKWKFIYSDKGMAIVFIGGMWMNDKVFIIKEITPEKITMLRCSKEENLERDYDYCETAYFLKE